jgi:DNA ligase (NAD+)
MGKRVVKKVVDAGFNTLDKILNNIVTQLSQVEGFAEITAKALLEGVINLYPEMVKVLNTQKITIREEKMSGKLKDKSFCFTGKLDTLKRAEAEELVIENGGEVKKSVVKRLTYLVSNSTEMTVKFQKAQQQGT